MNCVRVPEQFLNALQKLKPVSSEVVRNYFKEKRMSKQIVASAREGRIMFLSNQIFSILTEAYDQDRLTLLQDKEYEKIWELIEYGEDGSNETSN